LSWAAWPGRGHVSMILAPGWRKMMTKHRACVGVPEAEVFRCVNHFGDIREAHGGALPVSHDQRLYSLA